MPVEFPSLVGIRPLRIVSTPPAPPTEPDTQPFIPGPDEPDEKPLNDPPPPVQPLPDDPEREPCWSPRRGVCPKK